MITSASRSHRSMKLATRQPHTCSLCCIVSVSYLDRLLSTDFDGRQAWSSFAALLSSGLYVVLKPHVMMHMH